MSGISPMVVRLAVAVAVPTLACFGLYSLDQSGGNGVAWASLVILAYPLAIIGLVGVVAVLTSPKRSQPLLWFSTACVVAPVVFLLFVRG